MSTNSQRLASIIAQKNSPYRFQGLPDEAAVRAVVEGSNAVYIGDKKEASGYPCKIFDENGKVSDLFYVKENQAQYKAIYEAIQKKASGVLAKILEERKPYAGKDDYSFKIVDGTLDAACTDKNTVYIERKPFKDKGHRCKIVDEKGNATIIFYVLNFKKYEDISLEQDIHKAEIEAAKKEEIKRANHAALAEKLRADSSYTFEEVAFDALLLPQHENKNTVYISKEPNTSGYRCKIVNEQGHAVSIFSIDSESEEHKEILAIIEAPSITQEVTFFAEKLVKAEDFKQIKVLEAELLGKIDKVKKESVKGQLREKVIAIAKVEMTKRIQYELLAEALENKDYNLEFVSPEVVSSDEKADDHMIYIAEKVDDKGTFIGYRCKITDKAGKMACRFSISLESEEHKKIHTIIEAQKEAEVIAAPFKKRLDKAKTQDSIENVMYSFSQEVEITANEIIQQKLSVINEEMGKIASQKFQGIQDIVESEMILRAIYALSNELNVQCDLESHRSEAEESGFFSTFFGSNETQFEELEVVIEIRKKIEEIDEKLKSTENDQALRILKEANSIANKALNYTGIFFKGTDSDKAVAKKELEKLLENKSPLISSSSDKIARKGENSKKSTSIPNISEMSDVRKSDEEKAISNCNSLLAILEKKQSSEKDDVKAQLAAIKELLNKVEQFNFQSSILSGFINAIYSKLMTAFKMKELTVENVKQLYADIRLEYSELLNAAQELASSDAKAAQELASSKAKAAQELASSNAQVAEKAVLEKSEEKGENEKQIKEVEEKLKSIAATEKSIRSIEEIKTEEAKNIRLDRKLLLGEIKETLGLGSVKDERILSTIAALGSARDKEQIQSTIKALDEIVEEEFKSLNDYSLTDEEKKIKIGTEVFDEKAEDVINTLELLQHDITQKMSDCDKEIKAIEAKIKVEGEQASKEIQEFIVSLTSLDEQLKILGLDNTHSLKKVLGGAIKNLENSREEMRDIKPEDRIMLLEMEKRNISDAIEKSLQDKTHKLSVPSHEEYVFAKDLYSLEQKKAEKNKLKEFLSVLRSICSTIKDSVEKFWVFRTTIRIGAVLSTKQAGINREKANQEKIKQGEQLAVLTAQKETLEQDLIDLDKKKESAIAERKRVEIATPEELANVDAKISEERARFEAIISAERGRLEAIITKPFQLFIVTDLRMREDRFKDIKGNAVILDDKNKVHFIIDGKKVLDKDSKPKEVTINDRHSIPLAARLQIFLGEFKEITDYRGVCDVIKQAARNGGYNLQYDTKAEETAEDKAILIREAREKGINFKEKAAEEQKEAENRAAQEAKSLALAKEVKKKESEKRKEEKQTEPTKQRVVPSLEDSLAEKRARQIQEREENEAKQAAERAALKTFGTLNIDEAAKRSRSNTPQEIAKSSVQELIRFVSKLSTNISRLCANDENRDESQTQSKAQLEQILTDLLHLSNKTQSSNFDAPLKLLRSIKTDIEDMKGKFETHKKLPFDQCIESLGRCIVNFEKLEGDVLNEIALRAVPVTSGPPHSPAQPRPINSPAVSSPAASSPAASSPTASSPTTSPFSFFGELVKHLTPERMAQNLGSSSISVKNG